MIILHIANISNIRWSGVSCVVPQHVNEQCKIEKVALVNLNNEIISNCISQLMYEGEFKLEKLDPPFNRPDLVVFHEVYHFSYIKVFKMLELRGIPYIIIPHSSLTKQAKKRKRYKKLPADILFFNGFISHAKGIQCLSKNEFDNSHGIKKKFISTNGMYLPNLKKDLYTASPKKIIYIGRLEMYQKGLDLMVEAVKGIMDQMEKADVRIDIYGPDINDEGKVLRKLINYQQVDKIIKVHDEIYGKEKESILLQSDLFIQTSRFEGMPMGVLEALSYGIPCLVTTGTTLGSCIKEDCAGWESKGDALNIQNQILEAIATKPDKLNEMSNNARSLVIRNYRWEKIAASTIRQYRQVLEDDA